MDLLPFRFGGPRRASPGRGALEDRIVVAPKAEAQ